MDPLTWGAGWAARDDRVAANGGVEVPDSELDVNAYAGPVVLDHREGEPLAYAPIRDRDAVYTDNGHLQLRGFTDGGQSLLMVVRVDSFRDATQEADTYLVEWVHQRGEFRALGRTPQLGLEQDVLLRSAVAVDALAEMAR